MEDKYRQLLEQFIEYMEVFNETGFDDDLQELEEEVTRVLKK